MIRFVFLDLDATLLDFLTAEAAALTSLLKREGIEATPALIARYSAINDAHWKRLERGELTRGEVRFQRFQVFFGEIGHQTDVESARLYYEQKLASDHYFMPGAEDLLRDLDGKYRLFIMSNGSISAQNGRIASANIAHYFEKIFLSEAVGYMDKSIPQTERAELYIGDNYLNLIENRSAKNVYMPIPQSEIDVNPEIKQTNFQ